MDLKNKRSFGFDGFSNQLLKHLSVIFCDYCELDSQDRYFSCRYENNNNSSPQKSDRNEFNKYRPVSLLSSFAKVIHLQLYDYLDQNRLLTEKQYGFRENIIYRIGCPNCIRYFSTNVGQHENTIRHFSWFVKSFRHFWPLNITGTLWNYWFR